jgi:hypothetical protein
MMKTQKAKTEREVPEESTTHNRWTGMPFSSNYYDLLAKRKELPSW